MRFHQIISLYKTMLHRTFATMVNAFNTVLTYDPSVVFSRLTTNRVHTLLLRVSIAPAAVSLDKLYLKLKIIYLLKCSLRGLKKS